MLKKGGNNWVEEDRFFDRKVELEILMDRMRDGDHTLTTALERESGLEPRVAKEVAEVAEDIRRDMRERRRR